VRVATRGRGGYCFHTNGALSELLRSLGYTVERHVGGVHGPDGASEAEMANHLVLTVHDLPNDANPMVSGTSTPGWATRCTSDARSFGLEQ
jgi:N-hydroxyarylamine O-acetyltransferase